MIASEALLVYYLPRISLEPASLPPNSGLHVVEIHGERTAFGPSSRWDRTTTGQAALSTSLVHVLSPTLAVWVVATGAGSGTVTLNHSDVCAAELTIA